MRLVVDASTLVAEALRARGRRLLAHPALDLLIAAEVWSEAGYELRRRAALLNQYGHLEIESANRLLDDALDTIASQTSLIPSEVYADRLVEALAGHPACLARVLLIHADSWS